MKQQLHSLQGVPHSGVQQLTNLDLLIISLSLYIIKPQIKYIVRKAPHSTHVVSDEEDGGGEDKSQPLYQV